MKIGILSGKGGTGKTTLATNLGYVLQAPIMIDADVEEPNLHLFFKEKSDRYIEVKKKFPVINNETCVKCGACGEFCRFNALLPAKKTVLVYAEMCHACGGCAIVCPNNSVTYKKRVIGRIEERKVLEKTKLYSGRLNVGELSGVEIIKSLNDLNSNDVILVDSPPGTSCATAEAIKTIDYAILVTEATVFGMSDLLMIIELLKARKIPFGVVINKAGLGDNELSVFLKINEIQLLGEIPFDKKYAYTYSKGDILSSVHPEYYKLMENILLRLPFDILGSKGGYCDE